MKDYKHCIMCGTKYFKKKSVRGKRWTNSKYCGRPCQLDSIKGWNKGKTGYVTPEGRKKMVDNARNNIRKETVTQRADRMKKTIDSRNANGIWAPPRLGKVGAEVKGVWLDEQASYNAKHRWIQNHWQKSGICEHCSKKPRPFGNRKYGTEWSNKDGLYNRNDRESWQELCVPCHREYDRSANNN